MSDHLPSWHAVMLNKIPGERSVFIFELCDAIRMVRLALNSPRGQRACFLCVDAQAAFAALVKGLASSALGDLLTSLLWKAAARGSTLRRAEYVQTKSNDVDAPPTWRTSSFWNKRPDQSGEMPTAFVDAFSPWVPISREATVFNNEKINRPRITFPSAKICRRASLTGDF